MYSNNVRFLRSKSKRELYEGKKQTDLSKGPKDTAANILNYKLESPGLATIEVVKSENVEFVFDAVDERSAAAMCYTSGTTGNPKGVMYSHRSTFLHSLMVTSTANIALAETDRMLVIIRSN